MVNPIAEARKRALDSTRAAQKQYLDELKAERQQRTDSIAQVRKQKSDSLAAVRKYRESKQYQKQIAQARQQRLDSIQNARKAVTDVLKQQRQAKLDSTLAGRKVTIDALKEKQKKRTDSLATIRKYKESKRYQDSIVVVRRQRMDSMKAVRVAFNDSASAARKYVTDSMAAVRKGIFDSTTAVRTKYMDSIKTVRKVRTDSLAKIKEKREKNAKDRLKNREEKFKLALELKIKKKREAWSNEKMLKKRWSAPRKAIQNTFTRYNYYFNTENKMNEALANMQRIKKENYDSLLALFPFDPDKDTATLAADMDSIKQKASVGIQIHDPRTKWGDDLYLLLGQSYYYKGDFENAAIAFKYIVAINETAKNKANKNSNSAKKKGEAPSVMQADDNKMLDFLKHRSVHNEALLWLARTYTEWHKEGEAESVLDLLSTDPNLPENLKGRLALEKAYVNLSQKDYKNATENLAIVVNDKEQPDWIRQRAAYINGQLLYERGEYTTSAASYDRVIDLQPKIDMDFYARKNKAYSLMMAGGEQEDAVASLRKILKDGKYVPYYEQVYYVIGRLSANSGKYDDAISYLNKGLKAPRATRKQKAMSFAALGNVYYTTRKYNQAKQYYDSAALLASSAPNDSLVAMAMRRGMALGDITKPTNLTHMQDSLLQLAALSDREQRAEVRKYIAMLQRRINDSIFAAENAGLNNVAQAGGGNNNNAQTGGSATNWYFANPILMQQGFNDFKRKWGSRPNVDKWRRAASISLATKGQGNDGNQPDDDEKEVELDENGLPTEESLLAFIPNDPDRKEQALKMIRRAYIDVSDAYIRRLEDYPEAIGALDTLVKRFPAHEHKAEELYLRYLVALRQSKPNDMDAYANQLLQQYPDSKWAQLVKPTEDNAGMNTGGVTVGAFHDETYQLLLQRQYSEALMRAREGQKKYNDNRYYKKFRIIESIGLIGTMDYDRADTVISDFIRKYPVDSLRPWADMVLEYIKKWKIANPVVRDAAVSSPGDVAAGAAAGTAPVGTNLAPGAAPVGSGAPAPGNAPPPPLPVMEDAMAPPAPKDYSYNPKETHYVVFAYPGMEQRAMGVKAAVNDFNTFKFAAMNLDVQSQALGPKEGIVVIRKFDSPGKAKIYLNDLKGTTQVFREYKKNEYDLFMISESNYLKMVKDGRTGDYLDFYKAYYK